MIPISAKAFIYSVIHNENIDCDILDADIYKKMCRFYREEFTGKGINEFLAFLLNNKKKIYYDVLKNHIEQYVDIDKDEFEGIRQHLLSLYKSRRVLSFVTDVDISQINKMGVDTLIERMRSILDDIYEKQVSSENIDTSIVSAVDEVLNDVRDRANNPGIPGISTGYPSLDKKMKGYEEGQLIYIGARPSMGKTTFMLNSAYHVASNGYPVLIVSRESPKKRLIKRLVSMLSEVPINKIEFGENLTQQDIDEIRKAATYLKTVPIHIDGKFDRNFYDVLAMINKEIDERGIRVVFIDYIQLLASRGGSMNSEIGRISRELKLLANQKQVTMVVLSQLNRAVEAREDKRPILPDLRESGDLEQDGDIIMFLYRDYMYNRDKADPNSLEVIIAKNRDGESGLVELFYEPSKFKIIDREV